MVRHWNECDSGLGTYKLSQLNAVLSKPYCKVAMIIGEKNKIVNMRATLTQWNQLNKKSAFT